MTEARRSRSAEVAGSLDSYPTLTDRLLAAGEGGAPEDSSPVPECEGPGAPKCGAFSPVLMGEGSPPRRLRPVAGDPEPGAPKIADEARRAAVWAEELRGAVNS